MKNLWYFCCIEEPTTHEDDFNHNSREKMNSSVLYFCLSTLISTRRLNSIDTDSRFLPNSSNANGWLNLGIQIGQDRLLHVLQWLAKNTFVVDFISHKFDCVVFIRLNVVAAGPRGACVRLERLARSSSLPRPLRWERKREDAWLEWRTGQDEPS